MRAPLAKGESNGWIDFEIGLNAFETDIRYLCDSFDKRLSASIHRIVRTFFAILSENWIKRLMKMLWPMNAIFVLKIAHKYKSLIHANRNLDWKVNVFCETYLDD